MLDSIFTDGIITLQSFIICMVIAMIVGILNAIVFSFKSKHSSSFSLTLALLPMAVAVVIMMVNGNIGAGVAVAGAFALVRFRSIPGSAKEIAAIFIDMAIGLILGMGFIYVAIIFFAFVAVFTLVLTGLNFGAGNTKKKSLKITIPEDMDYDGLFDDIFEKYLSEFELTKVKTTNMGTLFELSYEVLFKDGGIPKAMIDDIRARNGNLNVIVSDFSDKELL